MFMSRVGDLFKLTAVMIEAARCLPLPGNSCRLPGRKNVAVGHGEGSGGTEDAGVASVVESWAETRVVVMRRMGRERIRGIGSNSIMLLLCWLLCFACFYRPMKWRRADASRHDTRLVWCLRAATETIALERIFGRQDKR